MISYQSLLYLMILYVVYLQFMISDPLSVSSYVVIDGYIFLMAYLSSL